MEQPSLAKLDFQDIYVPLEEGRSFLRDMRRSPPLFPVPDELSGQLEALKVVVLGTQLDTGRDEFRLEFQGMTLRASHLRSVGGDYFVLRRLWSRVPELRELGYAFPLTRRLRDLGEHRGLFLVSGATGTGKSTLAGAFLASWVSTHSDVAVTIEDPPEMPLNGSIGLGHCFQVEAADGDFETPFRKALRQSPRYIFLGEVRTPTAAAEAIRVAASGHLLVTTVHAGSIPESLMTLARLASGAMPAEMVWSMMAESFLGAIHLRWPNGARRPEPSWLFGGVIEPETGTGLKGPIMDGKAERLGESIRQQKIAVEREGRGGAVNP
jgi:hypothetical protein